MNGTRVRRLLAVAACLAIVAGAGLAYLNARGGATPRLAAKPAPLPAGQSAALRGGSARDPASRGGPLSQSEVRAADRRGVDATGLYAASSPEDAWAGSGADEWSKQEAIDPRAQPGVGMVGSGPSAAAPDSLAEIAYLVSRTKWISGPADDVLRAVESLVLTREESRGRGLGARDLDRQKLAVDRVLEAAAAMLRGVEDAEGAALMEEARLALGQGRFEEAEDLIRATVEAYEPAP